MSINFSKDFYTHSIGRAEAFNFKEGQIGITTDDGNVPEEVVRRVFSEMRDTQQRLQAAAYHVKKWREAKKPHWNHFIYNFMRLFEQMQKIKPLPFPISFFDECQCYGKQPILLRQDFLDSTPADFTYVVEGKEFPCHTAILMLYPYWRAAFSGFYQEERRVVLHDIHAHAFEYFLGYLYDHQIPIARPELTGILEILCHLSQEHTLLLEILILADRFMVQDLKERVLVLLQENDKAHSCLRQEQILPAHQATRFPAPEWPLDLGKEKAIFYVEDKKIEISKILLFTRSVYFRRLVEQSGTNEVLLDPGIPFACYELLLLQRGYQQGELDQAMAIGKFTAAVTPENIFKIFPIVSLELRILVGILCEMLCEWIKEKKVERADLIAHDELIPTAVIDSHWDTDLLQTLPWTQILRVSIRGEFKKIDLDFLVRISSGKLAELYIPDAPIDVATLVKLKGLLPHLQILELNAKNFTDDALREIAKLPLTELILHNCVRIRDISLLAPCTTLQRLTVTNSEGCEDLSFLQLARAKNNWTSLSFVECPVLSEETQAAFVNPHLRNFKIANTIPSDIGIDVLLERGLHLNALDVMTMRATQSLHHLDRLIFLHTLSLNMPVSGAVIESALAILPFLRRLCLHLFSAHNIFGRILTKYLTEVDLQGVHSMTPLLEKNRSLALIILRKCKVNAEELRLIATLQCLFRLEFHNVEGVDDHVACLNGIRPLEHMEFRDSLKITSVFQDLLATQKELYSFVYYQPRAIIASLLHVLPLRDLQELVLAGCVTNEDGILIRNQAVKLRFLRLVNYY